MAKVVASLFIVLRAGEASRTRAISLKEFLRVPGEHGVKPETIQAAARIGAVVKAVATVHATL